MCLPNCLAIADHASVTHLTSQTIHALPLSQQPPQCPALPCHHHVSLAPLKSVPSHLQQPQQAPTWPTTTCHVAEIDVATRTTNEEHLSVSVIPGKCPHYPFMNSHWDPQCHVARQRMWLPTHLDDQRLPTSHHPPPRSGDDLMTPHILQPTTPSKVPPATMDMATTTNTTTTMDMATKW